MSERDDLLAALEVDRENLSDAEATLDRWRKRVAATLADIGPLICPVPIGARLTVSVRGVRKTWEVVAVWGSLERSYKSVGFGPPDGTLRYMARLANVKKSGETGERQALVEGLPDCLPIADYSGNLFEVVE